MKEEQIAWKKAHIEEKKVSMKRCDDHHDYSERRMYMITLEIEGRQPLFGHLEGDPFAPTGSADSPHIELSALGQAVRDEWMGIPRYFPQIEVQRYLDEARNGAILVSPAISPGEKRTMREAFNAGLPTIVIMENGFTPLSKPHGEQFYACAQGRLLMLSAWEHHNEKRKLTAEQCRQLNLMALSICE